MSGGGDPDRSPCVIAGCKVTLDPDDKHPKCIQCRSWVHACPKCETMGPISKAKWIRKFKDQNLEVPVYNPALTRKDAEELQKLSHKVCKNLCRTCSSSFWGR